MTHLRVASATAVFADRLSVRQRLILAAACAPVSDGSRSEWPAELAVASAARTTAVLNGDDERLTNDERAMATWARDLARSLARDPDDTAPIDVRVLREAGLTDDEIIEVAWFVARQVASGTGRSEARPR